MKDENIMRIVTVYTRYCIAYANDPNSSDSDNFFDILLEGVSKIDPDRADDLLDTLCRVNASGQITYEQNLRDFLLSL